MQLPRSTYIVCDPCYVMLPEAYDQLCDLMYPTDWQTNGTVNELKINGHDLWVHGTAYGDGTYSSNSSISFAVDSGTIGAVPLQLCDPEKVKRILEDKEATLFEDTVIYTGYSNGMFTFAGEVSELCIFTEDDDEEEEDFDTYYDTDEEYDCEDDGYDYDRYY